MRGHLKAAYEKSKIDEDCMNIQVETYAGKNGDQIVDLILGIQNKEFEIPITINDQPDLLSIESFYQKGAGNFWVARDGNKVVGTIALIDIGQGLGALRKMFVAKEYRGREKGVAQLLLDVLLSWARENGMREIYLGTIDILYAARRFYLKNGFEEIPKSGLPSSFPIMAVDTKFYRIQILS